MRSFTLINCGMNWPKNQLTFGIHTKKRKNKKGINRIVSQVPLQSRHYDYFFTFKDKIKKHSIFSSNWSRGRRFYPFVRPHIFKSQQCIVHARFNFSQLDVHMPSQSIFVMTWPMSKNSLTRTTVQCLKKTAASVFKIKKWPEKQFNYTLALFKMSSHRTGLAQIW